MNNWVSWTILWCMLYIATAIISVFFLKSNHWITLFSIIILVLYELVFIKYYLKKKRMGLRAIVCAKIDEYKPSEDDYEKVMAKIGASISTNSAMVGVAFTLLVFSLGFLYLAGIKIGANIETALIFGVLLSFLISGVSFLIVLDQYDTAAEPSIDIEMKWKMRKQALNFFVTGWYFVIFGIMIGLSLLHPFLTLAGCTAYTLMHNIFWFQRL